MQIKDEIEITYLKKGLKWWKRSQTPKWKKK